MEMLGTFKGDKLEYFRFGYDITDNGTVIMITNKLLTSKT